MQPPEASGGQRGSRPVLCIVGPGVLLLDFAGVAEPFRLANAQATAGATPPFALSVHGPGGARIASSLGVALAGVRALPRTLPDGAFVLLAGVTSAALAAADGLAEAGQQQIAEWLRAVVAPALAAGQARLWTVCSGAFAAARAGLLDGRECTTHHSLTAQLAAACPRARVLENRIFVADGPVASSAGITAGIDLALHAIGAELGAPAALAVARELVVYHRRAGADPQLSPLLLHRNHLHAGLHRAQDAVLAAPARAWSVQALAAAASVSPRHLARLFRSHVGIAPLDYLQRFRLGLARELLADRGLSIEQVAERCGFGSAHHLRRAWRAHCGGTPGAARGAH